MSCQPRPCSRASRMACHRQPSRKETSCWLACRASSGPGPWVSVSRSGRRRRSSASSPLARALSRMCRHRLASDQAFQVSSAWLNGCLGTLGSALMALLPCWRRPPPRRLPEVLVAACCLLSQVVAVGLVQLEVDGDDRLAGGGGALLLAREGGGAPVAQRR